VDEDSDPATSAAPAATAITATAPITLRVFIFHTSYEIERTTHTVRPACRGRMSAA